MRYILKIVRFSVFISLYYIYATVFDILTIVKLDVFNVAISMDSHVFLYHLKFKLDHSRLSHYIYRSNKTI